MKSDTQLQQDVMAELKWDPAIHAAQIGVEVKDSVVTLSGEVDSFGEKWDAERAAQRVNGVNALAVELKVRLSELGKRSDADIARMAENVLSFTGSLPVDSIKVLVEEGWLTLSGDVEWQYQRQMAAGAVRYLSGVTGVSNMIGIKPRVSPMLVKADIEASLKRRAIADAREIHVAVNGTEVVLSGKVHSWSERDVANHSAWGTLGVHHVVDNLTIVS